MGSLLTPDTFEFFSRYLLSGFECLSVRNRYVQGERLAPTESIVEAVILSLINQVIFLFLFGWLEKQPLPSQHLGTYRLLAEVIALPAFTGTLAGWLVYREFLPEAVRRLIMPLSKAVSHAHEHAFARLGGPTYLIVAYQDGREVYGYFGLESSASSDLINGGLFIERLYDVDDTGEWTEAQPSRSAWISLGGAKSIEFLDSSEV